MTVSLSPLDEAQPAFALTHFILIPNPQTQLLVTVLKVSSSAETNSDFRYSNSCFLNDQIPNNWCTHTETHAHTHTHTETHAHTPHTHTQSSSGTHNLQRTFFSSTISKYSHTGLLKGLSSPLLRIRSRHMEHHVRADYVINGYSYYVL